MVESKAHAGLFPLLRPVLSLSSPVVHRTIYNRVLPKAFSSRSSSQSPEQPDSALQRPRSMPQYAILICVCGEVVFDLVTNTFLIHRTANPAQRALLELRGQHRTDTFSFSVQ